MHAMEIGKMGMILTAQAKVDARRGERGAALIMTLLVATLLLSVGGALIFTAAMSGTNASDSTTEMQAYYGAEAGLQTAINVVRGNVDSDPANTKASFRNIADNPTLSKWVTYNAVAPDGTSVVKVSEDGAPFIAYRIRVIDPDATLAANEPQRLLIQVRGYGPRGAVKNKEMIVNKFFYDPDVPAAITLIGAETGVSMLLTDFDIGDSSPKGYTGTDSTVGSTAIKATFGFTQDADKLIADAYFAASSKATDTTDNTPRTRKFTSAQLPSWLRSADATRTFLNDVEAVASDEGRLFTAAPADFGTAANPKLTFVKGDCELSGNGGGLLVVTGNLVLRGNFRYDGVILALGTGSIVRNGGGGGGTEPADQGGIYGGMVMAVLDRATAGGKFLAKPTFNTNGGGNADIKYNSLNVENAFKTLGPSVKGVREF
jgi:hypothetical protein